jgi:hypothetical protein
MPRWAASVSAVIRDRVARGQVRFTLKSISELAMLGEGLDESDICEILADLRPSDLYSRLRSASTLEWMYVFKPHVGATILYIKVIVRASCIVISCHDDQTPEVSP